MCSGIMVWGLGFRGVNNESPFKKVDGGYIGRSRAV